MDEVQSTESVIISSYPTSASGIIVLLNTKHWIKISQILFLPTQVFGHFEGKFSVVKFSVSIFGQTMGYRNYTMSREPIRLPEVQYTVFGIL